MADTSLLGSNPYFLGSATEVRATALGPRSDSRNRTTAYAARPATTSDRTKAGATVSDDANKLSNARVRGVSHESFAGAFLSAEEPFLLLAIAASARGPRVGVRHRAFHLRHGRQAIEGILQDVHEVAEHAPGEIVEESFSVGSLAETRDALHALVYAPEFFEESRDDVARVELVEPIAIDVEALHRVHHRVRANQRGAQRTSRLGRPQHGRHQEFVRGASSNAERAVIRTTAALANQHRLEHLHQFGANHGVARDVRAR